MKSIEIKGSLRSEVGKKAMKKLRREENVPCNLYGGKAENVMFYASEPEFRGLVYSPNVYNVKLNIDGKMYNAIMQDIQFHPVSDKILHIDFYQIFEDRKFAIHIPVILNGLSKGVREGGKLHQQMRSLKVSGLLKDIPDVIEIDVTELGIAQNIRVGDLHYEGIELLDAKNVVIATVRVNRASKEMAGESEEAAKEGGKEAAKPAAAAAKPAAAKPAAKK